MEPRSSYDLRIYVAAEPALQRPNHSAGSIVFVTPNGAVAGEQTAILPHRGATATYLTSAGRALQAELELVSFALEALAQGTLQRPWPPVQVAVCIDNQALLDLIEGRGRPPDEHFTLMIRVDIRPRLAALGATTVGVRAEDSPARTRARRAAREA